MSVDAFLPREVLTALDEEKVNCSDFLNDVPVTVIDLTHSPVTVIDLTHSPAGSPVKADSPESSRRLF